jgi:Zn-dependent protease with chaperone function
MRKLQFRQFVGITLMSLCLTARIQATPTDKDEIEQALAAIGSGSAEELKRRLFTYNITVVSAEFRARALNELPAALREQRLTQGKLLRRVAPVFQQVLQLHERSGKVELFLFQHDLPLAQLWRGGVLMISDCLAEALYDGELAGLLAHELGHSYFEDELAAAQRSQDARAMRLTELKCDGVALVSLKLLGHKPALYLKALHRIQVLNQRKSRSSGIFQSHPGMVARAQFAERLIKSIG